MALTSRLSSMSGGGGTRFRALALMIPYVARYKGRALAAVGALVAAAVATLAMPLAIRRMIDVGFSSSNAGFVNRTFLVLIVLAGLLALASSGRYYLVMTLGERIVADLRRDVFTHLMRLSAAFFDVARSGDIVSRLSADTTQIKSAVGASASIALRNLVLFLGATIMMVVTSPRLSGLILIVIPVIVLPLVLFGRRVRRNSRFAQDRLADASAFAAEALGGVRTVQAYTLEARTIGRFTRLVDQAFEAARIASVARAFLTAFAIFLVFGSVVGVLWLGAHAVLSGEMSGGTLGQFVLYSVFAAGALGELSQVWGEVSQAAGATERLAEILATEPEIAAPERPLSLPAPAKGAITFENVHFGYASSGYPVLHAVSLSVRPGERVAIVGPSGAGKSTLFALLMRFYDPTDGRILIDGVDVRRVDPAALRERIGLVPQDAAIFAMSAEENIGFGDADAEPRGDTRGGARGARRRVPRRPAARLQDRARRARRDALRRAAPAHRNRARHPEERTDPASRRSDERARRGERDRRAGGARSLDGGADDARHRAPSRHHQKRRPHRRHGRRTDRRGGHASEPDRAKRPLCAPRRAAIRGRRGGAGTQPRLAPASRSVAWKPQPRRLCCAAQITGCQGPGESCNISMSLGGNCPDP